LHPNAARANRTASKASLILAFVGAAILAGCGGGQPISSSTTTGGGGTTTPVANSLQLLAGSTTIPSAGGAASAVALTAIVLDMNNNALTGQTVEFGVADPPPGQAFINNVSSGGVSDANGQVIASLNLGTNKSNRTITVTASVTPTGGGSPITATVNIAVVGTTIAFAGGKGLVFGAQLPVSVTLSDSGKNPVPGQALTFTSAAGNTITPATATTNANGVASFTVTGTVGGSDTITATGAGVSQSEAIQVNSANFLFQSPAAGSLVVINTPQVITVHWDNANVPVVGQPILLSSTRGTLSAATIVTDGNGNASTSINSPGAGPSTITAVGPGGNPVASPLNIVFVTTTANKVSLQAAQASIPVNIVGQTTNQTQLTAIVRDVNDNLVQGATVNFQIVADPSGGSLNSGTAVTDISGSASVNYIAGSTSSGSGTVVISATVISVNGVTAPAGITANVDLTVNGQALFIRMQTDNLVQSFDAGTYTKAYYALVTDSAGNPVTPVTVVFSLEPTNCIGTVLCGDSVLGGSVDQCTQLGQPACPGAYAKGSWLLCTGLNTPAPGCPGAIWAKIEGAVINGVTYNYYNCLNEDVNFNGILDPGEDYNHNSKLDPGNVAGVAGGGKMATGTSDVTDSFGIAVANVTYVKGYATWSAVKLTATITVSGTEFIQSIPFILPIEANDIASSNASVPGQVSPFGQQLCINPN
jgi:hypothetical protein